MDCRKILIVFCLAYFGLLSPLQAQEERFTLAVEGLSMQKTLDTLSSLTDIVFIYSNDIIPRESQLYFSVREATLDKLLKTMFKGVAINFFVDGNEVILVPTGERFPQGPTYYTISGEVRDATTGESLLGTSIFPKGSNKGTSVSSQGFYSLTLPKGNYTLVARSVGYQTDEFPLQPLTADTLLNLSLTPQERQLEEVTVLAGQVPTAQQELQRVQMGTIQLSGQTIREMPSFLGENDPVKALQLLPGVQFGASGDAGFFVRGGSADQNLILIDNMPLYNVSHFLGFFSVFNPDLVKEVNLYKGSMPARYGGRLSSVLDVQLKEGRTKKLAVSGGIGSLASRLSVEVPIFDGKGSVVLGGRRTYLDLLVRSIPNNDLAANAFYFYDLNFKASYRGGKGNKFLLSAYSGRDQIGLDNALSNSWGNRAASFSWQKILHPKWFSDFTAYYSSFRSSARINLVPEFGFDTRSSLQDIGLKQKFSFFPKPAVEISAGLELIHHRYSLGEIRPLLEETAVNDRRLAPTFALEQAYFIEAEHELSPKLSVAYGLRYSVFSNIGPARSYGYNVAPVVAPGTSIENIVDTTFYRAGQVLNTYHGPEPRFSLRHLLSDRITFKIGYNRTRQYVHQLMNVNTPSPADSWAPVNTNLPPQRADQLTAGITAGLFSDTFTFSAEGYYKQMYGQIDFKPAPNLVLNDHLETEVLLGDGRAYGAEFLLRKEQGKHTGWLGYTYAVADRQINGINANQPYPAAFDRRHNISGVYTFSPSPKFTFSANWVYASGVAFTFPVGRYEKNGLIVPYYTVRNGFRLPDTHRLDISFTFFRRFSEENKNESSFNFSIYNLYARKNTYTYLFRQNTNNVSQTEAVKLYLFTILPSFTYNFKF